MRSKETTRVKVHQDNKTLASLLCQSKATSAKAMPREPGTKKTTVGIVHSTTYACWANYIFQKMTSFDHENWHTAGGDAHDNER